VPIYKKGNKEEVQNHRPIAILPELSKIFELAIKIRLTDYFDKQSLKDNMDTEKVEPP
jgi:hypothetical protein